MRKLTFVVVACMLFTLSVTHAAPLAIHRYDFSESSGTIFADDIGTADLSLIDLSGSGTTGGGQGHTMAFDPGDGSTGIRLYGGAKNNADYVKLPNGLVSGLGDATFECWATQHSTRNWSRVFSFGSTNSDTFLVAWTRATNINQDAVRWVDTGVSGDRDNNVNDSMQPYTLGQEFHLVFTVDEEATGPGSKTVVSWYKDGVARGSFDTDNTLSDLGDTESVLGRSKWGDDTADASWNEFRIYDVAMTAADVAASFAAGRDAYDHNPMLTWDQASDGNWGDLSGGISRWVGGDPGDIPTADFDAVIKTNTVSVALADQAVSNLTVESGALTLAAGRSLSVVRTLNADPGTTVTLGDGATLAVSSGTIDQLNAAGNATIEATGGLAVTNYTDGGAAGTLTKQGAGTLTLGNATTVAGSAFQVDAGTLSGSGASPLGAAQTLLLNGGTALFRDHHSTPVAPGSGQVAYYSFDDGGNLGNDSSGAGNHLVTGVGSPAHLASGKFGGALDLSVNSTLVPPGAFPTGVPTGGSAYTISTWINPETGIPGNGGWLGWGNYGTGSQVNASRMDGTNRLHHYWWGNDLNADAGTNLITGSPPDGWHHVLSVYDPALGSNQHKVYIDGVLKAQRNASGLNAQPSNFAVGKTTGTEYFKGYLDELFIYNRALNATEIQGLYGTVTAPDMSNVDVLVSANSTLESRSSAPVPFRDLTLNNGVTLASTGGDMSFASLAVAGGAGRSATLANDNNLNPGTYSDGGAATTVRKAGTGTLTLDYAGSIAAGATTLEVAQGTLEAVGPVPQAAAALVRLSGGTFAVQAPAGGGANLAAQSALAYFSFDNAADLGADTSNVNVDGRNYSGTLVGSPTQAAGVHGGAIDFERDNGQYVDLPDGFDNFDNGITVAAWVNYESFTTWNRIVDFGNADAVDNIVLARRGGEDDVRWEFFDTAGGTETHDLNDLLPNNQWIHIAATTEPGGTNTSDSKIYINGALVGTKTDSTVPRNILRTRNYIGESNWSGDDFLDGLMDELYIFNMALDQSSIVALMNNANAPIDLSGTPVEVTADSTLEAATFSTASFGDLTLTNGNLTTAGALGGMSFASTSVASGATAVGVNTMVDAVADRAGGDFDGGGSAATFTKTGSADFTMNNVANTAGMSFDVQDGRIVTGSHMAATNLALSGTGTVDTGGNASAGGNVITLSGRLEGAGEATYTATGGSTFGVSGADVADRRQLVLNGSSVSISPPPGPIAHWAFDESSGATVATESIAGYDGTLENMDSGAAWIPGKINNAIEFTGSNDNRVNVAAGAMPDLSEMTASVWVSHTDTGFESIFHTKQWSGGDFHFVVTDRILAAINGMGQQTGGNTNDFWSSSAIPLGTELTHVAVTYSLADHDIEIYLNGQLDRQTTITGNQTIKLSHGFFMGADNNGTGRELSGGLDELFIYDYDIGQAGVDYLYQAGLNGFYPAAALDLSDTDLLVEGESTLTINTEADVLFGDLSVLLLDGGIPLTLETDASDVYFDSIDILDPSDIRIPGQVYDLIALTDAQGSPRTGILGGDMFGEALFNGQPLSMLDGGIFYSNDGSLVQFRAYIPEPGTMALLGLGLLGLARRRRRRTSR